MSRRLKIALLILFLVALGVAAIALKFMKPKVVAVDTTKLGLADISSWVSAVPVAGQPAAIVKPEDVKVIPKVSGELKQLLVEEGNRVEAGQIIAYLDPKPLQTDILSARASAEAARARLREQQLSAAAEPARVQTALARAQANYQQALVTYQSTVAGYQDQLRKSVEAVRQAEAALKESENRLSESERGARPEDIARARETVRQADAALTEAENALAEAERGSRPEEIAQSEAAERQAEQSAEAARLDYELVRIGAREEDVAKAEAALTQARSTSALRQTELETQQRLVAQGYASRNSLAGAQSAYDVAQAQVDTAARQLDLTRAPYRPEEVQRAKARYEAAQAALEQSRQQLALAQNKTTPEQLRIAQARRDSAASQVAGAQQALELALHQTTPQQLQIARAQRDTAASRLESARRDYALAETNLKESLGTTEAQVAAQQATVQEAADSATNIPQQQQRVQQQRGALRQAEALLSQALERAGYTIIRSPIAGLVSILNAKEGEWVQGGGIALASSEMAMLTIVDMGRLRVEANVDESDVPDVRIGQRAKIIVKNGELSARVQEISPSVRLTQGEVRTFAVKLTVYDPKGRLRPGMSVDVDIITGTKKQVPAISTFSVGQDDKGKFFVYLIENGRAKKQLVEKGIENLEQTEIKSGAKQGDEVITSLDAKGLKDKVRIRIKPKSEEDAKAKDKGKAGQPKTEAQQAEQEPAANQGSAPKAETESAPAAAKAEANVGT